MSDNRPVNLDLGTVSFPITAIASILHRICAVISWVGLGFLLCALCYVMAGKDNYMTLVSLLETHFLVQFVAWGLLTAFAYYCLGISFPSACDSQPHSRFLSQSRLMFTLFPRLFYR